MTVSEEWIAELAGEMEIASPKRAFNQLPIVLSRRQVAELLDDASVPGPVRLGWRKLYSGCLRAEELQRSEAVLDEETASLLEGVTLPEASELSGWLEEKLGAFYTGRERRVVLQAFRHAGAVHCLENGMDLIALHHLLGHSDYKVTAIYLRAAIGLLRSQYLSSHPLAAPQTKTLRVSRQTSLEPPEDEEDEPDEEEDHVYARLSQLEVDQLLEAISNPKHRLVVRLLYAAGLRRAELVRLDFDDFNACEGRVFVRGGKGGKDRYCLIDYETMRQVLAQRVRAPKSEIFGLGVHMVYDIVDKAAAKTGLDKLYAEQGLKISPHSLRNTFASHCYLAGMSTSGLSRLLGHSKMSTLLTYLDCPADHRQEVYDLACGG